MIAVLVQSLSGLWLFVTPWTAAHQASLPFTASSPLLRFMSIELVMLFNFLILCHPLLLLPSIFPSIRVFSKESALYIRWPKYWSFSFSISPSNEFSGLISFRIDWFDLAVQGILKSLLQHHISEASILRCPAFYWPHYAPLSKWYNDRNGEQTTRVRKRPGFERSVWLWKWLGEGSGHMTSSWLWGGTVVL